MLDLFLLVKNNKDKNYKSYRPHLKKIKLDRRGFCALTYIICWRNVTHLERNINKIMITSKKLDIMKTKVPLILLTPAKNFLIKWIT